MELIYETRRKGKNIPSLPALQHHFLQVGFPKQGENGLENSKSPTMEIFWCAREGFGQGFGGFSGWC